MNPRSFTSFNDVDWRRVYSSYRIDFPVARDRYAEGFKFQHFSIVVHVAGHFASKCAEVPPIVLNLMAFRRSWRFLAGKESQRNDEECAYYSHIRLSQVAKLEIRCLNCGNSIDIKTARNL